MKIKSQSQIIGSVLMILIVIALIVIVLGVIMPFVKNQLEKTKCLDVTGQVEIVRDIKYTCFNVTSNDVFVQIHIKENRDLLDGFVISLGGADSKNFEIKNQSTLANVQMYDGSTTLTLPGKNEDRTYQLSGITTKPETISVYPIMSGGKTCDPPDTLRSIEFCRN